jgi:hypothetical protein
MRPAVAVCCLVAGCSFQPGQVPSDGQPVDDGTTNVDARLDAKPLDAAPDAFVPPTVTDHGSVADTHIVSNDPNQNFNGQESTLVDGAGNPCVILMRFDLSSISTAATVSSAALHIWTDVEPGADATLYPVLQSWVESKATWNERDNGTDWTTAGAAPPSRGATAIGTVTPTAANTAYTITITPATVQGWVANPSSNFGVVFVTTNIDGTRFVTRENPTSTIRPFLRVTHIP